MACSTKDFAQSHTLTASCLAVDGLASSDESDSDNFDSDSNFLDSNSVEESYPERLRTIFGDSDSDSSCHIAPQNTLLPKKRLLRSRKKHRKQRSASWRLMHREILKRRTKYFWPSRTERYPLTEWSLTVTRTGEDVHTSALDTIYSSYTAHCTKGGVSTEVGSRARRFHLQGVFQTKFPTDDKAKKYLCTFIRNLLLEASGYRVLAKKQNFNNILKDELQPWFQCRIYNVSRYAVSGITACITFTVLETSWR